MHDKIFQRYTVAGLAQIKPSKSVNNCDCYVVLRTSLYANRTLANRALTFCELASMRIEMCELSYFNRPMNFKQDECALVA